MPLVDRPGFPPEFRPRKRQLLRPKDGFQDIFRILSRHHTGKAVTRAWNKTAWAAQSQDLIG